MPQKACMYKIIEDPKQSSEEQLLYSRNVF